MHGRPIDVSVPLNHTFSVAHLRLRAVMVAFPAMMVAFSTKGGYGPVDRMNRRRQPFQGRLPIKLSGLVIIVCN